MTGSGKTLAYSLPICQHLRTLTPKVNRSDGLYALIVVPTRELSLQTHTVITDVLRFTPFVVASSICGGEKRKSEKARLRKGVSIVVGTPGRLLDHLESTNSFKVNRIRWFVLDEADRLLDLGFEKVISKILTKVREKLNFKMETEETMSIEEQNEEQNEDKSDRVDRFQKMLISGLDFDVCVVCCVLCVVCCVLCVVCCVLCVVCCVLCVVCCVECVVWSVLCGVCCMEYVEKIHSL
jgi:superfamily II DNA/RNA helicase